MQGSDRVQSIWFVGPVVFFLQSDPRILLPFWRTGIGERIMPPGAHFTNLFLVLIAWIHWMTWQETYFRPKRWEFLGEAAWAIDSLVWLAFALIVFFKSRKPALESAWRRREEMEIAPSNSVGWPRVIDVYKYSQLSPMLRRRRWAGATLGTEFLLGALFSGTVMLITPSLGCFLLLNVFLLSWQSQGIVSRERKQRVFVQDQMSEQARVQRIFEEIEVRRPLLGS